MPVTNAQKKKLFLITDSTDIALAIAATGTQSNIGASFTANIPANGIIRLTSFSGRFLNNAIATAHFVAIGIRIGSTNYWFGKTDNSGTANIYDVQFTLAATANKYLEMNGAVAGSNGNGASYSQIMDVSSYGIPTGNQTIQLIAGYDTTQSTIKGTVKQTRVFLEITDY